jgi:type II secretory pathway component PulF
MNLTFAFSARQPVGTKTVSGLITAESDVFAMAKVKKMGFINPVVSLDIMHTLANGFGFFKPDDFDLREKARFYETISKRIKLGGTFKNALDSAKEYIEDGRLLSAVAIASAAQESGLRPWKAMEMGGFAHRDVMVVKALDMVGGLDKSFWDLAQEAKLRHQTQNAVLGAMRMPQTMTIMFYFALPLFFGVLGPQMLNFFKKLGSTVNIPPDIQALYSFVGEVNDNPIMWFLAWIAMGFGAWLLLKSNLWQEIKSHIKSFHDLDLKSEHAQIWSVYALMYSANIAPQEICAILRPACKLTVTGESLYVMSRRLAAGADEISALEAAQFPRFVNAGYRSAKDSGDLPDGLKSFCQMLQEDVQVLTEKVQAVLQKISLAIAVVLILAVFYITYYPIAGPMLQSL